MPWPLFLPLLLVFSTLSRPTSVFSSCLASEREALLDFKHNFHHVNSTPTSWSGSDCCRWKGVECSNGTTGHVIKLILSESEDNHVYPPGLQSEILPSLCQLKHLQQLHLGRNFFSGQIPVFFGCFQELTYLNLSQTNFSGTIPSQLGNLSKLQTLDLSLDTYLEFYFGFEQQIGLSVYDAGWLKLLTSLQYLDMSGVNLQNSTNFFQSLNLLPSLSILRCDTCGIRSLPESLPNSINFSSLTVLDLNNNGRGTIPDWLFTLTNLQYLDLGQASNDRDTETGSSSISSPSIIPFTGIGNLVNLRYLDLSGVGLNGSIPASIGKLSSLEALILANNGLSGRIPDVFGSIQFLQELDLSKNHLSGSLPTSITRLPLLKALYLSGNELSGSIPTSWGRTSSLLELDLSGNMLNGSIPESLCGLTKVQILYLSSNFHLSGSIPECIGQLKELQDFQLDKTNLSGVITESHFANLTNLIFLSISSSSGSLSMTVPWNWNPPFQLIDLRLDSCKMRTRFPKWIRNQSSFDTLYLTNAEIHGELPSWIWDFKDLPFLDLSSNNLSGHLPPYRHSMVMAILNLSSNKFEGEIPSSFCNINLNILDLSRNQLSGELRGCLLDTSNVLNLAGNNLSGSIADSTEPNGNVLNSLQSLHLENNNLSGVLPYTLKYCSDILAIDVSGNKFNGNIPTWLGENMSSLKILNLRDNDFSGSIPSNMSGLSSLRILDLAGNKLSGQIPDTFGNFTAMMSIDTSFKYTPDYAESVTVTLKGQDLKYTILLPLIVSIDLSGNQLSGKIPSELGSLVFLRNLNFSDNLLSDNIPTKICELSNLESLDLSRNHLSGQIPKCMTSMSAMGRLDLSHNNLSGRIPWESQMTTFSEEYFEGNVGLCGSPLLKMCESDHERTPSNVGHHVEDEKTYGHEKLWVYLSVLLGFIVGFWMFYGTLFFKEKWRYAYFHFLGETNFMLYIRFRLLRGRVFK